MNKAITYGVMMAAASLLLLACERRGGELTPETRTIQILSTVTHDKVSKGVVLQNTPLSDVRFLKADGPLPSSWVAALSFSGNRAADGSITWQGTAPTYDRAEKNAHFVAYHPQGTETTNTQTEWTIDGKTDLLLSTPWDAGKYSAPKTGTQEGETPLTFDHILAQLSVVFKAAPSADATAVQQQYGRVTGVKFYQTLPTATYSYASNKVSFSGTPTDRALWQPDGTSAFAPVAIPAADNTQPNAWGILAPTEGTFVLDIATERFPSIPVVVQLAQLGNNKNFEAGRHHTVTLEFQEKVPAVVVVNTSIGAWNEASGSGLIDGGVANQFALQLLESATSGYDYTKVKRVRLTANGVGYDFSNITFESGSNALIALTDPFAFTAARPEDYPYTVELVELLDENGVAVTGSFGADVAVARGGLITMQLFRGRASELISGTSFVAYGSISVTDAPIYTGTVADSPIGIGLALGNGAPTAGNEATAVAQAKVRIKTADGVSHTVTLSPYVMTGTPLAASSTNVLNIAQGKGWPAGARYPYQITHVAFLDKNGGTIVPSTALAAPLDIRWSTSTTLTVMKFNSMFVWLDDDSDWLNVSNMGDTKTVKVGLDGAATWTAQVLDGSGKVSTDMVVRPSTGGNGASVQIAWSPNLTAAAKSGYQVKFFPTGYPDVNAVIQTSQQAGPAGVVVGNVRWATGNLVATNSTAGAQGKGGCTIGAPSDGGLYFQFGSLIGYKGGNQSNGGTGVGIANKGSGTYWGSSYTWASEAMVWPSELVGTKATWTNTVGSGISTLSDYYFNYSVAPWETRYQNIRDFAVPISGDSGSGTLATGRYAKKGVGDPCTYYLGGTWRLPTGAEYTALFDNVEFGTEWGLVPNWSWVTSPTNGASHTGNSLFFPASGYRESSNGSFNGVTANGFYWSSSVNNASYGSELTFSIGSVFPQDSFHRSYGFPVRCVTSVP